MKARKKFWIIVLGIISVELITLGLSACNHNDDTDKNKYEPVAGTFALSQTPLW